MTTATADPESRARQICIDTTDLSLGGAMEAVCCYDLDRRCLIATGMGKPDSVPVPDSAYPAVETAGHSIRVIHTHPESAVNVSLSESDVSYLWTHAGVLEVEAVLLDGSWFRAGRRIDTDWAHESAFATTDLINAGVAAATIEDRQNLGLDPFYNEVRTHLVLIVLDEYLREQEKSARSWFSWRRPPEYGFTYIFELSEQRRHRWAEPQSQRQIQGWVSAIRREYRRIR
ncbi:hypothetical protein [Paraburkholderia humisilvae]|uniref:JAB domain-containing protein n=1 Tax=Paraburkholderia humisilvae TaxID=627669 RepID=A0A6J5FD82_9BURK|nr:hypothetical protein [Paraburkholderia humisilvae]CAB3775185.1 hypothetical protein LMG29542_08567 [Paraburkholderia humisilvae]